MNYEFGEQERQNPEENAGFLSRVTFFYTLKLFKSHKEKITYRVLDGQKSKLLGDQLKKAWDNDDNKKSIYKILWNVYGQKYIFIGIIQLIVRSLMIIFTPLAISKLISYFTPGQINLTKNNAIFYTILIISLSIVNSVYLHNYLLKISELGLKIKTAFCMLIYKKILESNNNVSTGKIITLMTKDVNALEKIVFYGNDIWIGFAQAGLVCYLVYLRVGISAFAGIGVLFIVLPIQIWIGKRITKLRQKTAGKTDSRLQIMQETITGIKVVKNFVWEEIFAQKMNMARKEELRIIIKIFYTKTINLILGSLSSKLAFQILLLSYLWMENLMKAEDVFYIITCFARLKHAFSILIPTGITEAAELQASLERISDLLNSEENFLKNVKENYVQLKPGVTAITGQTGSGKSILLEQILLKSNKITSYTSESPWIFPSTIKENILFTEKYHKTRYEQILQICGLKLDLQKFPRQDLTVLCENGINLSRGQKSRIHLARCIYKDSDIYLIDDCLSSLDTIMKEYIFQECFRVFLKDKIVVLVTHDSNVISKCDNVILMENHEVKSYTKGDLTMINIEAKIPYENNIENITSIEKIDEDVSSQQTPLIIKKKNKTRKTKKVSKTTYKKYIKFGGGFFIFSSIIIFFIATQISKSYTDKMTSSWVDIEENISRFKRNNMTTLKEYKILTDVDQKIMLTFCLMILATILLTVISACIIFNFTKKASSRLHEEIVFNIINASMDFFNKTLTGNILNRCSKDLAVVDEELPIVIYNFFEIFLTLLGMVFWISYVSMVFIIPTVLLFIILYIIRSAYLPTGRYLHRLDAETRSPFISHLNSTVDGLKTIKSNNAKAFVTMDFEKYLDRHTSANYMLKCTSRAFGFTLDLVCIVYISAIVTTFLIFDKDIVTVGDVGLAISQSFGLTGLVQYGIRQWADVENKMISVERLLEYTEITSEDRSGQNFNNWPCKGKITFKNVSLKSHDTDILKKISFVINPGEKILIIGDTGAGKTSIITCLLRLFNYNGKIIIDDININQISLECLRRNISVIPQDPHIFSGSLRSNIDPKNSYTDQELWMTIKKINLQYSSLDYDLSNLSSGEKQLICLSRALLAQNQIIILDESTSNMDDNSRFLIRDIIKEQFKHCTVITVSHSLEFTFDFDKVMVMCNGEIIQFEDPKILFYNEKSGFRKMVDSAGLSIK